MTVRETIIETQNLTKYFGALAAVDDVSIKIEAGTLHALLVPMVLGRPPSLTC